MNLYREHYYLPGWTNIKTFHDKKFLTAHFLVKAFMEFSVVATWRSRASCSLFNFGWRHASGLFTLKTFKKKPGQTEKKHQGVIWPSHATIIFMTQTCSSPLRHPELQQVQPQENVHDNSSLISAKLPETATEKWWRKDRLIGHSLKFWEIYLFFCRDLGGWINTPHTLY